MALDLGLGEWMKFQGKQRLLCLEDKRGTAPGSTGSGLSLGWPQREKAGEGWHLAGETGIGQELALGIQGQTEIPRHKEGT